MVHRHRHVDAEGRPLLQVDAVEHVRRGPRAVQHGDPAKGPAVAQHRDDRGPQRREADPAGDHHHVVTASVGHVPSTSESPADTEHVAWGDRAQRPRDATDVADGVDEAAGLGRVAADGDRHLADAEGLQHRELPGVERQARAVEGSQVQGDGVVGVTAHALHAEGPGHHHIPARGTGLGVGGRVNAHGRPRRRRASGSAPTGAVGTSPGPPVA